MVALLSAVVASLWRGDYVGLTVSTRSRSRRCPESEADLKCATHNCPSRTNDSSRSAVDHETSMTQMGQTFKCLSTKHSMRRCSVQSISRRDHKLRESKIGFDAETAEELLGEYRRISRTSTP